LKRATRGFDLSSVFIEFLATGLRVFWASGVRQRRYRVVRRWIVSLADEIRVRAVKLVLMT
jgi:hypothetical protein